MGGRKNHRPSHSVPDGVVPPLVELSSEPEVMTYCQMMISDTVKPTTENTYRRRAATVAKVTGGLTYQHFLRFLMLHDQAADAGEVRRLRTTTLIQTKSAVMWVCSHAAAPWTDTASRFTGLVMKGRLARDTPPIRRGQITFEKVQAVAAYLRGKGCLDEADGITVIYGACCRPHDIRDLRCEDLSDLNTELPLFWAGRKGSAAELYDKSDATANPITTREALNCLIARVHEVRALNAGNPEAIRAARLFPFWDEKVAIDGIKHVATVQGWSEVVTWNLHGVRHGSGRDKLRAGPGGFDWSYVQDGGQWETEASAQHYAQPRNEHDLRQRADPLNGAPPPAKAGEAYDPLEADAEFALSAQEADVHLQGCALPGGARLHISPRDARIVLGGDADPERRPRLHLAQQAAAGRKTAAERKKASKPAAKKAKQPAGKKKAGKPAPKKGKKPTPKKGKKPTPKKGKKSAPKNGRKPSAKKAAKAAAKRGGQGSESAGKTRSSPKKKWKRAGNGRFIALSPRR